MKITSLETFLVNPVSHHAGMIGGKNWLFVKLETDDGLVGWGEAYTQLDRDRSIERTAHDLGRYLVGSSPFEVRRFREIVYADFAGKRSSMELYCALSALEQAMWDLTGKALGQPVYNLLGGACRDRIRVYANGWYGGAKTPEAYADMARKTVARGFTALKFDPFPGPWRLYIDNDVEQAAVANVAAVREAVGPEVDLLIEVHRRLSPMCAIRIGKALEQFGLYWFEEPVPAENLSALAEVRAQVNIPVVTGEALYGAAAFREVFERRAADIVNPDVCNCGGILELVEIAAMAAPSYVAMSPHNYNSTSIGLAATIQAAACMPNFVITEYFLNFEQTSREIVDAPFEIVHGCIPLPIGPGLGIDLVETELRARPFEQASPRNLPRWV